MRLWPGDIQDETRGQHKVEGDTPGKTGDVSESLSSPSAVGPSVEMSVAAINGFRDTDVVFSLNLLEASDEANQLKLFQAAEDDAPLAATHKNQSENPLIKPELMMDTLFLKVLERKVEILQWQFFHNINYGDAEIMVNIVAKKQEQFKVNVPFKSCNGTLCLPFGGCISTSQGTCRSQPFVFCTLFGLNFYVHGKQPDLNSASHLVPAWGVKVVSKSSDCFFKQVTVKRDFLVVIPKGKHLMDLYFVLAEEGKENLHQVAKNIEKNGDAAVCFLSCLWIFSWTLDGVFGFWVSHTRVLMSVFRNLCLKKLMLCHSPFHWMLLFRVG